MTPVNLAIGDVLMRTWELYRAGFGACIVLGAIWLAACVVGWIGLTVASSVAPRARDPWLIVLLANVAVFVGLTWIHVGQCLVLLDLARGREAVPGDVFQAGRFLGATCLASVFNAITLLGTFWLASVPGALVAQALGFTSPPGAVALGFGIAAGLIAVVMAALRLSQFVFLVIDRSAGVLGSLRGSVALTRGNAAILFVIYVITVMLHLAGVATCLIGLVFTQPLAILLLTVTYLALVGESAAGPGAVGATGTDERPL
jgi:hypothetical protein